MLATISVNGPGLSRVTISGKGRAMSIEEKKALVRRITEELRNRGNLTLLDDVCVPSFTYHDPAALKVNDLSDYKQFVSRIRTTSPDMHYTTEDIIAEADKVVVRYTWDGTNRQSGRRVTHVGVAIYHFSGAHVVELWDIWDALGAYQQLGIIPALEE
jgi:hypothetical protein